MTVFLSAEEKGLFLEASFLWRGRAFQQVLFWNFALSYNELAIGFSRKFPIMSKRRALILRFLAPQRVHGHT